MNTVFFYKTDSGKEPAKEFVENLDKKLRAKVLRTIELLQEYGHDLREPYSKFIRDGIFELRVQLGSDNVRILYFFFFEGNIILTNGFMKKSQKYQMKRLKRRSHIVKTI